MTTDPVPLYSVYSRLLNVNKVFLDSRPRPTLSCLVAEKKTLRLSTFIQKQAPAELEKDAT